MAKVVQLRRTAQALPDTAEHYRDFGGIAVVSLVSLAPDCGKTTLAAHLAVQAQRSGAGPIVLLDMAPDGALERWAERRGDRGPPALRVTPLTLAQILFARQGEGETLAFVDTPAVEGADSLDRITAVADLVLIACPAELRWLAPAKPFAEALARAGPQVRVVASRVPPDSDSWNREMWVRTATGGLCRMLFNESHSVAAAMTSGETVLDMSPNGDAAREIANLWQTISPLIKPE